jgi:hypothetical protein
MPKLHLTKSGIDGLTPDFREMVYWDDTVSGFGLKVTPHGRKVFIVLYRTKGLSRLRKYTIGTYGPTTLAIARIAAQKVLADRNEGKDPAREKRDFARKWSPIRSKMWSRSIVRAMLMPSDLPMKSIASLTQRYSADGGPNPSTRLAAVTFCRPSTKSWRVDRRPLQIIHSPSCGPCSIGLSGGAFWRSPPAPVCPNPLQSNREAEYSRMMSYARSSSALAGLADLMGQSSSCWHSWANAGVKWQK